MNSHTLDKLKIRKGPKGVGFKVSADAEGKNAIVTKVRDPKLRHMGLCPGAVVTDLNDVHVLGDDHWSILEKYRSSKDITVVFQVPGERKHLTKSDVVRKSGHKFTMVLLLLSFLLCIAGVANDTLQTADWNTKDVYADIPAGTKVDIQFGWKEYKMKVGDNPTITDSYSELDDDSKWEKVSKGGGLFFGFSVLSLVLFSFLIAVGFIFATRRPRALIEEAGELLRTSFVIVSMGCTMASLTTWSAWISTYELPDFVRFPT
eukprot:UN30875